MRISKVEVDEYGRLAVRGIHDAAVEGFRYVNGMAFDLQLCGIADERQSISLRQICRFGMKDVVNGTIISDIYCWMLRDPTSASAVTNDAWRTLLAGNYIESGLPALIENLTLQFPDHVFVFFESSYGGTIAAICREIFIDSGTDL
jgi:hypothetical protein